MHERREDRRKEREWMKRERMDEGEEREWTNDARIDDRETVNERSESE